MKYIIEIKPEYEDTTKGIMVLEARDSKLFVDTVDVANLEELNSDYINEHYGELQDTAYQRGLEEGKAIREKGCEGCEWEGTPFDACERCCNNYKNMWRVKSDKIEVGDELTAYSGVKCIATIADYENDIFYVLFSDGSSGKRDVKTLKKTGRHFDIQKILEEMRNE